LRLTRSTVERGLVLLERDSSGVWTAVSERVRVAIARCGRCRTRTRVLPADVLPRKAYSLPVIEHLISTYARGELSLREVAWNLAGERAPAHTSLHGWTEGLGAYALGRREGQAGGAPVGRFLAEAKARVPEVAAVLEQEVQPDTRRYRSEPRRDRLAAMSELLLVVALVAALPHPRAMTDCRRLALVVSSSSVLQFPSRLSSTPIEHRDSPSRPASRSSTTSPTRNDDRCPTRTRSPPGASNTSPH
jgi:hypothetical protein